MGFGWELLLNEGEMYAEHVVGRFSTSGRRLAYAEECSELRFPSAYVEKHYAVTGTLLMSDTF